MAGLTRNNHELKAAFLYPLLICLTLSGCEGGIKQNLTRNPIETEIGLTRDEFKEKLIPPRGDQKVMKNEWSEKDDLSYSPVILAPDDPALANAKKVTLSITDDIPIKDVLIELARLANLELALDSNISGGIILKVTDRPIKDVIELVADQASLRYSVERGVLRVQKDDPYLTTYKVDYINLDRSSTSTSSTQTQLLATDSSSGSSGSSSSSSSSSGSSQNMNSGSMHEITSSYNGDIWKSVEDNLSNILALPETDLHKISNNIQHSDQDKASALQPKQYYTINKQAGIITVMADSKRQRAIKQYLDYVKESISSQVLIEAKIVEVDLNDNYTAGINWSKLAFGGFRGSLQYAPSSFDSVNKVFSGVISTSQIVKPNKGTGGIDYALTLLEGFGTTRTLFNPRINAINNQQAILTFATNKPYFTVTGTLQQTQTTSAGSVNTPATITSTLHSIPVGMILTLQPSINLETQEITMSIKPTLTIDTGQTVQDPAVQILNLSAGGNSNNQIESAIPVIEVKEIDTILKAKSGDVMVIGGLIQHNATNTNIGLPGFSKLPLIGKLARQNTKKFSVTETVVLIQATIVPNASNYHPQDRKVYETFIEDSRPLKFNMVQ